MNEPLLLGAREESKSVGKSENKLFGKFQGSLGKKYKVQNVIKELVKLPVPINQSYLEKCAEGVAYDLPVQEPKRIWDPELGRLNDPKEILEGIRIKTHSLDISENFIVPGQVAESEGHIFIGCKDQSLRQFSNFDPCKATGGETSAFATQEKQLCQIQAEKRTCATLNLEKQLFVYQVVDKSIEEKLTLKNISGFELKKDETLYYSEEGKFYKTSVDDHKPQQLRIDSTQTWSKFYFSTTTEEVLAATSDGAVYLLAINDESKEKELLLENQPDVFIRGLHYGDNVATIVTYDNGNGQTTVMVINLSMEIEPEEEEEESIKSRKPSAKAMSSMMGANMLGKIGPGASTFKSLKTMRSAAKFLQPVIAKKQYETTYRKFEAGECHGVSFSKKQVMREYDEGRQEKQDQYMLLSCAQQIYVLEGRMWELQHFQVKCDYGVARSFFSYDDKYIYSLGYDATLRTVDFLYQPEEEDLIEYEITDAAGSEDNTLYALVENQKKVRLFTYKDQLEIASHESLSPIFLIRFAATSSCLLLLSGTESNDTFNATIIVPFNRYANHSFQITLPDGYPIQADLSKNRRELYIIAKSAGTSTLYIFDWNGKQIFDCIDTKALTLSTDDKLLACTNTSKQIKMYLMQTEEPKKGSSKSSPKPTPKGKDASLKKALIEKEETDTGVKEFIVTNTIELSDNATCLQFFANNFKIVAVTANSIQGIDCYTHEVLFKIQVVGANHPFAKIEVIFDLYIVFVDAAQCLRIIDASYELDNEFISISSSMLKTIEVQVNDNLTIQSQAWSAIGYHVIVQPQGKAQLQRSPFLHHNFQGNVVSHDLFRSIKGYYLPILSGGPKLGTGSFSSTYIQAIQGDEIDATALRTPVYPYRLNSLHYFAITANVAGAQHCYKSKVKFMLDSFGKSPLDYAIESKDRLIIEAIMNGIFETEGNERTKIMRTLPLGLLLEHPSGILGLLLQQGGTEEPIETKFGQTVAIPTLFPGKGTLFAKSGLPNYSAEVAEQLHPPAFIKKKRRFLPVTTLVLNNPVPVDFTEDSLNLLKNVADCGDDSILRSKPITLYLNRKWNKYAYKFYLAQFFLFFIMLMSLVGLGIIADEQLKKICYVTGFATATYFTLWEFMQLAIQKMDYLQSPANIIDIMRLVLIYISLFTVIFPELKEKIPYELIPISFCLIWMKMLNYLLVFKPTRYLIKMIIEIIKDIKTFLIILFVSLFAYAQISYVLELGEPDVEGAGFVMNVVNSYVLSFGELGAFDEFSPLRFIVFVVFSFLIPLVLMNMLIALMSDSYSRVQTNAVAADTSALAEMEAEMEEVVQYLANKFTSQSIQQGFYYFFVTQVNDGEGDEDWEGMVGQLKGTIQDTTKELESNLKDYLNGLNENAKANTEKIVENILRTNKSELDSMDKVEKTVKAETSNLQDTLEQKMLEETNLINNRFLSSQEELRENFTLNFEKLDTSVQMINTTKSELNQQINETQETLKKQFEEESTNLKNNLTNLATDLDQKNKTLQEELQKAQSLVSNVGQTLDTAQKQIIENVEVQNLKAQVEIVKFKTKFEEISKEQKVSLNKMQTSNIEGTQKILDLEEQERKKQAFEKDQKAMEKAKKLEKAKTEKASKLQEEEQQKQEQLKRHQDLQKNFDNLSNYLTNLKTVIEGIQGAQKNMQENVKKSQDEQKEIVGLIGQLQNVSKVTAEMIEQQKKDLQQSTSGKINDIQKVLMNLKEDIERDTKKRQQLEIEAAKAHEQSSTKISEDLQSLKKEMSSIKKEITK